MWADRLYMTSPNFWAEFTVTDAKFRRPPSKVSLVRVTPRVTVNCPELDSLIGTELAPRAEPSRAGGGRHFPAPTRRAPPTRSWPGPRRLVC